MAASGIAAEIAAALQRRNGNWLVSLRPVEGVDAPANLDDLLLAEMVQAGVPVAAENGADAALQCRVSATGTTERPRGVTAASVDPTAQTMLVCLLATGGRYVWAAHRTLRPRAPAPSAAPGTILEITG